MSALVVSVAALASSRKGTTCPISESATSFAHSPGRDPGPDPAGERARQQHRGRGDADARKRETDGIEGARGDLDQKKGGAPEERKKSQRRICRHGALEI
jgi:hypothetical protein